MTQETVVRWETLKNCIGEVVITFQSIEYDLAGIVCALLQMKEKDDIQRIAAAMSFRQKVDLLCDIYPSRRKGNWPELDMRSVKKALASVEEFRNAIVHSHWYVGGNNKRLVWMRSKASLRSPSGLNHLNGIADINAIEKGVATMKPIRIWYLGRTEELDVATNKIRSITKRLTRRVKASEPNGD